MCDVRRLYAPERFNGDLARQVRWNLDPAVFTSLKIALLIKWDVFSLCQVKNWGRRRAWVMLTVCALGTSITLAVETPHL